MSRMTSVILVILSILILFVHCVEKIWKRMTFFLEVSFDALVLVTRTIVFNKDMLESNILLKLNLFLLSKIKPPSNSIETSKDDLESERNCGMDEIETRIAGWKCRIVSICIKQSPPPTKETPSLPPTTTTLPHPVWSDHILTSISYNICSNSGTK